MQARIVRFHWDMFSSVLARFIEALGKITIPGDTVTDDALKAEMPFMSWLRNG